MCKSNKTDVEINNDKMLEIAESGDYKLIDKAIDKVLNEEFKVTIALVNENISKWGASMDEFVFIICNLNTNDSFITVYFQGNGHRVKTAKCGVSYVKSENNDQLIKVPSNADVFHVLTSDVEMADLSFNDWCSNVGADNDSIRDLGVYNACVETRENLIELIGVRNLESLTILLSQY